MHKTCLTCSHSFPSLLPSPQQSQHHLSPATGPAFLPASSSTSICSIHSTTKTNLNIDIGSCYASSNNLSRLHHALKLKMYNDLQDMPCQCPVVSLTSSPFLGFFYFSCPALACLPASALATPSAWNTLSSDTCKPRFFLIIGLITHVNF